MSVIPATRLVSENLVTTGGSKDMLVDGSVDPVLFFIEMDPKRGNEFVLYLFQVAIQGGKLNDPANFSGLAGPLANGFRIGVFDYDDNFYSSIGPIKNNRDMNVQFNLYITDYDTAQKDVLTMTLAEKVDISYATSKYKGFGLQIADDMTGLDFMEGYVYGYYEG